MALLQRLQQHKPRRKALRITSSERLSVIYHDIFDFPLKKEELFKWKAGLSTKKEALDKKINFEKGFFFVQGKKENIYKRLINAKVSKAKLLLAKKVAKKLKNIASVRMVALTGSLAMENAAEESDIDLMIVTSNGTLWTTRLIVYLTLLINGFLLRRVGESNEKDRLCLNIWLSENDLSWKKKNVFTAHEILQTKVLLDKDALYKKFIAENSWALDYWPNARETKRSKKKNKENIFLKMILPILQIFEPLAFWAEYLYMKDKITRETITPTRALFHPYDWSRFVSSKMKPL